MYCIIDNMRSNVGVTRDSSIRGILTLAAILYRVCTLAYNFRLV